MKYCYSCESTKDETEFHRDKSRKDGLSNRCKACSQQYSKRYRSTIDWAQYQKARLEDDSKREKRNQQLRQWIGQHKYRYRVYSQVHQAVSTGKIQKASRCENCGVDGVLHAHHEDYDNPLDVVWLCAMCHKAVHFTQLV